MICRHWRGLAFPAFEAAYVQYLRDHTLPHLESLTGFRGASVLKRPVAEGIEFVVITRWETRENIVAFAGEDAEIAVVPEDVRRMMREFDSRARHYEEVSETPGRK
jgi:heme-degrading monooxygenase HmoA